jgi:hypothetical protein
VTAGRQLGLLWGAVVASLVALSPLAARFVEAVPACPFKSLSGLPCAGCGTTRAALALAGLDLPAAFAVNPLAALAWIGLVGGGLVAGALALAGRSVPEPDYRGFPMSARLGTVGLVLANWLYLIRAGT